MPHFLFKKPKTFSINFEEIADESASETPFWEVQRSEAVKNLTTFYASWQALWSNVKRAMGDLNLSKSSLDHLEFYETEQKKTVLNLLAQILVAWEKDDSSAFSGAVLALAKELRPSLVYFESGDEAPNFSELQREYLKYFTKNEAASLKTTIEELQRLSWHKFEFGDKVLSVSAAEQLLREQLGLSYFEFLDFATEPEFNTRGFYPALLQASADFGL